MARALRAWPRRRDARPPHQCCTAGFPIFPHPGAPPDPPAFLTYAQEENCQLAAARLRRQLVAAAPTRLPPARCNPCKLTFPCSGRLPLPLCPRRSVRVGRPTLLLTRCHLVVPLLIDASSPSSRWQPHPGDRNSSLNSPHPIVPCCARPLSLLSTPLACLQCFAVWCRPTSLHRGRRFCARSGRASPDRMPRCACNSRPQVLPSLVAHYSYSPLATLQFLSLAV